MELLKIMTREELDRLVNRRQGETKLGETVQTLSPDNWQQELRSGAAQFVLLGIPEDIGVRANFGLGGTQSLWEPALKALLNVQETGTLPGSSLAILGVMDCSGLMRQAEGKSAESLRTLVSRLDDEVFPVIEAIADAGKIPVVIGGGHNNAYPLLKGVSRSAGGALNCINLDAHSDYRAIEGRHSGNGFRYAKMDGFLYKYAILGLHRNYNSRQVLEELSADPDIQYCFYEDIFLQEVRDFQSAIQDAIRFTAGFPTGIEIDLDCIERTLSSAASPCGITTLQARQVLTQVARKASAAYLHITEGSVLMNDGKADMMTAKLASYLVTDFMRALIHGQTFPSSGTGS